MNSLNNVDFERFKKNSVDFSNEKMNMATEVTLKNRGLYTSDIEHGKSRYSDDNLLLFSSCENESEWCDNEQIKELRNKVIDKMSKRYYARI